MTQTILIIDDERVVRTLTHLILERHGYRVLEADTGDEGVPIALNQSPDLIIVDSLMPGMSSDEVCCALRDHPQTQATPIIMYGSHQRAVLLDYSLAAGANEYLGKPFMPQVLIETVGRFLEKPPSAT